MTVFIVLLLTVAAFAFIVYPFFKQKFGIVDTNQDTELQELLSRRDTTYSMLKELEFDYQSGVLTEEDYHDLEKRYKRKGVSLLRNIDQLGKGTSLDDDIEKQIGKLRRSKSKADDLDDDIEAQISKLRRSKSKEAGLDDDIEAQIKKMRQPESGARFCPQCGEKYRAGDRFCTHCGTRLNREEDSV